MAAPHFAPVDTSTSWAHLPPDIRQEIDIYETELRRVQSGLVDDKLFTEFRLRHGVYGQRQDRVQMQRIKIPMGRLRADQLNGLADIAEEYAVGVLHITTRQDFQCHFVDIDDTPNLMRRLAEIGITTREACGNVIRNVTCCPHAGVCPDEAFDVTPHAHAMAYFMLRHSDAQNFGRKFKISFSGCEDHACGLGRMHDIGAIARIRDGVEGFQVLVGGGLGSLPHQAKLYAEFLPAGDMLPLAQAIARVFARLGEKKNRAKARMKFLIGKLGIEEFRGLVEEERSRLSVDPRWESELKDALASLRDEPLRPPSELTLADDAEAGLRQWLEGNVHPQRQQGYSTVEIFLPLGDVTSEQARRLAALSRRFVKDTLRTSVDQNFLIRWVSNSDLPLLYEELKAIGLAEAGAGRLKDVVACPGTDSCKLGITSSRGLAAHLQNQFANGMSAIANRSDLKIKISGCFNSCGQHHIADIGLFGSVQRKKNDTAPVFQVTLGGSTRNNAESYGLAVGKIPSQNVDRAIVKVSEFYSREKRGDETLSDVVARLGKSRLKEELAEFMLLPTYEDAPVSTRTSASLGNTSARLASGSAPARSSTKRSFCLRTPSAFTSRRPWTWSAAGSPTPRRRPSRPARRLPTHCSSPRDFGCRTSTIRWTSSASISARRAYSTGPSPRTSCAPPPSPMAATQNEPGWVSRRRLCLSRQPMASIRRPRIFRIGSSARTWICSESTSSCC